MDVSAAIRQKRAVRSFREDPLTQKEMEHILWAGRRAQSSKNSQPWRFIAITQRKTLATLSKMGHFTLHLDGAVFAVAILTPHPDERFSIMFDAGQAAAYMQLAAWGMGIGSCLGTIYEPEQARELLGFPNDLHIRIAISFGYPADQNVLTRPNKVDGRKQEKEIIHWEHWGN